MGDVKVERTGENRHCYNKLDGLDLWFPSDYKEFTGSDVYRCSCIVKKNVC